MPIPTSWRDGSLGQIDPDGALWAGISKEDKVDKLDKEYVVRIVLETVCELGEARQAWVGTVLALTDAERGLALANAVVRRDVTLEAGGAKALGANAELREQALTIALVGDDYYGAAEAAYDEAFEREARAKQRIYNLSDTLKSLRDVLGVLGSIE